MHETADYGSNMSGVQAALREQHRRVNMVKDFKPEADKVARSTEVQRSEVILTNTIHVVCVTLLLPDRAFSTWLKSRL